MTARLLHYSDVENAHDDPARLGRLAGLIDAHRDAETLVVGTGDTLSPGVLPLVTDGEIAREFYAAVAPDIETFGNHEFDFGTDHLRTIIETTATTWLTANVGEADADPDLLPREGRLAAAHTEPWLVREIGDERVGLFGLTDPRTAESPTASHLTFADPVAAGRRAVAALRERAVDRIVCCSHCGRTDEGIATELPVDVILGGHVHSEVTDRIAGTAITRPGVNAAVLTAVDVDDGVTITNHRVADADVVDESLAATLRERRDATGLDEVVARVGDPIERDGGETPDGESRIGNLVADAYRHATGADVGLQNDGGIRPGPALSGEVTIADLISVVPFDQRLVVVELDGDALQQVFAEGDPARVTAGTDGEWLAHVSGARVRVDADGSMTATVGGEPIDDDATYTLATSEYVVATGGEFPALARGTEVGSGPVQYEALATYAREIGLDPAIEGRIQRERERAAD